MRGRCDGQGRRRAEESSGGPAGRLLRPCERRNRRRRARKSSPSDGLSHGSPEQENRGGERRRHGLGAAAMEEGKARVRV